MSIAIFTLGGQPQIVTLALDRLRQHDPGLRRVLIITPDPAQTPRYAAALACLRTIWPADYPQIALHIHTLTADGQPLAELDSAEATDAAYDDLHALFAATKATGARIHLCPTGGRRLLGMLALSAAQTSFGRADRVWHLISSDAARQTSDRGAVLHLDDAGVQLVRITHPPLGQILSGVTRADPGEVEARLRQRAAWARLSPRQRATLRAVVASDRPDVQQHVAEQLHITIKTVGDHLSVIYAECRIAWSLPADARLQVGWLRERFADAELH